MRHHLYGTSQDNTYRFAILSKYSAFDRQQIKASYIDPLVAHDISLDNVVVFTLDYNEAGKAPVQHIKEYLLRSLLPALNSLKSEYLYCADSAFFKVLTGQSKAEPHHGYVLPCKLEGFTHFKVVLGLNYQQLIFDPALQPKLDASLMAMVSHAKGCYTAPGTGIIKQAVYPGSVQEVQEALNQLQAYPELACDIEAFSLRFNEAGIATIAFAPDTERFVAFPCDYQKNDAQLPVVEKRHEHGRFVPNPEVRTMLKDFFTSYQGKLVWHNANYDVKVLIYTLWMKDGHDTAGLLEGLEVMTRLIDDTKIIAYLATNSTAGNNLKLKHLAHEFAGNWAVEDIKDIRMIPLDQLLQYNGVDALSTNWVKAKYYPVMVQDKQEELYRGLMLDSLKLILQIELTGMPMNRAKIDEIETKLNGIEAAFMATIQANPVVKQFESWKTVQNWEKDFAERKEVAKNPDKIKAKDFNTYPRHVFNPGSGPQLQVLLYSMLGLPVLDRTETKQPATGEDTLKKLLQHPIGQANKELIEALIGVGQVSTILSNFLPAFKKAIDRGDGSGIVWLHGSFNIGGTVSGRLSSSDPKQ